MIKKTLQNIFKTIFYNLFFKIYGKIENIIKINEDKRIFVKNISIDNKFIYKVYKIENARLYTDRIHDTAIILDNKIVDGPSFQLRNNNNSKVEDNVVFKKGTPRKLHKLNGRVMSLLTGGGGNNSYWHWMYDVLPRLKLCSNTIDLNLIDYFLLPNLKKKFQIETLKLLKIPETKLLSSEKFRHIQAKELILTDHPYVLTNNSHNDIQRVPHWIVNWLQKNFLFYLKKNQEKYPKKIYIDRSDSTSNVSHLRTLINENEIIDFLKEENFVTLRLSELSFLDQVNYFNNADYIIGLHGGGFTNLTFCKNNTKIIEFKTHKTGKMYENISHLNNLKHHTIACEPIIHGDSKNLGHIEVPLGKLKQIIYKSN